MVALCQIFIPTLHQILAPCVDVKQIFQIEFDLFLTKSSNTMPLPDEVKKEDSMTTMGAAAEEAWMAVPMTGSVCGLGNGGTASDSDS